MGDENHIYTLRDYSKPSYESYRNTIKLPIGNNMVPLRSNTIRMNIDQSASGKLRDQNAIIKTRNSLLEKEILLLSTLLGSLKRFEVKAIDFPQDVSITSPSNRARRSSPTLDGSSFCFDTSYSSEQNHYHILDNIHVNPSTPPDPSVAFNTKKSLNSTHSSNRLEHTKSVYLINEEDKRRGVEYMMSKILGLYKECLELRPEYLTGMDDEGEVTQGREPSHNSRRQVVIQNVLGRQNKGQGNNALSAGAAGFGELITELGLSTQFKADDCDAFDSDIDEAPTAQTMFMTNLSSVDPVYDEAVSRFSDIHEELNAAQKRIAELESENSNLQNKIQNDDHDAQLTEHQKLNCVTMPVVKSKVLAPGRYAIDIELILSPIRNNREAHLDYLKHLKESVKTLHEIVEEAKTMHKTNEPTIPSTGVNGATAAGESKPKSNTKKDMTLQAKSDMQKVEVRHRKNKSSVKQKNRVDSNIIYKCTPMFDEYMEPPRIKRSISPAPAVLVPVNSAGTPLSTSIDQDAPSPSHSPSSSALQSLCLQQGVAAESTLMDENLFSPVNNDPFINIFASKPTSKASSSGDACSAVSTYVTQTLHHLEKWSKDHLIDNVIVNPSDWYPSENNLQLMPCAALSNNINFCLAALSSSPAALNT
nr:integrase, catalytic region, zinc finger, CCHC-type, peptidase aspartic, catalytic [Tanacetum cinerariifolium]